MVYYVPEDRLRTEMIIPVTKNNFFNNSWQGRGDPPCAYDMLYHPPDYNPKAARSDRQEPQIIRKNIWDQEYPKPVASTSQLRYGRPYWPIIDRVDKTHCLRVVKNQRPEMRIYSVLEWAVLLTDGRPTCVND